MSYATWDGDHEAVRKFAKAVASAIYYLRMKDEHDDQRRSKAWYDEITLLRSASSARIFMDRALILLEQGHRKNSAIATEHWNEDFNPKSLMESVREHTGREFETFRDLFRMYLIQESTYRSGDGTEKSDVADAQSDRKEEDA